MQSKIIRFASTHEEPYPTEVQGESYNRANIEKAINYTDDSQAAKQDDLIAHLILENENLNDANAVRVEINGYKVGYLSRPAAKKYRESLATLGLVDIIGECYASVRGGHYRKSDYEKMDFGIRLDIDLHNLSEHVPFKISPAPEKIEPAKPILDAVIKLPDSEPVKQVTQNNSIFGRIYNYFFVTKHSKIFWLVVVLILFFLVSLLQPR